MTKDFSRVVCSSSQYHKTRDELEKLHNELLDYKQEAYDWSELFGRIQDHLGIPLTETKEELFDAIKGKVYPLGVTLTRERLYELERAERKLMAIRKEVEEG